MTALLFGSLILALQDPPNENQGEPPPPIEDWDSIPGQLFKIHGRFLKGAFLFEPPVRLSCLIQPETRVARVPGSFDLTYGELKASLRIPVRPDLLALCEIDTGMRSFDSGPDFPGLEGSDDLYRLAMNVGALAFLSDDVLLAAVFTPGIYSDLDGTLQEGDWRFIGSIFATIRSSPHLYFKLGFAASDDFAYPLAGLAWLIGDRWRLDVFVPNLIELSFFPSNAASLVLGVDLDGGEFRWHSPAATGRMVFDVDIREVRLFVGGSYAATDKLRFWVKLGCSCAGRYEFKTTQGRFEGQQEPAFFAQIGLDWVFY